MGQGQGHRDQIFVVHEKVLSQGMCVQNIKGIPQLVWELKTIFENLNANSKPKRRLLGQGQGHRDPNYDVHGKVLNKGMCVPNIKGIPQKV